MALEDLTGTKYIDSLVNTNPASTDDISEGDDHLRGIKNVLLLSFPGITGPVTSAQAELNLVDGAIAGTIVNSKAVIYGAAGEVNATTLQVGGTSITSTPAEINTLDGYTGDVSDFNLISGASPGGIVDSSLANPAGWQYLASLDETTVTESDLPTVFSDNSGYDIFRIQGMFIVGTASAGLQLQVSNDGSTYEGDASEYSYVRSIGGSADTEQTHVPLIEPLDTAYPTIVDITIANPNNASYALVGSGLVTGVINGTPDFVKTFSCGFIHNTAEAVTGFKIYPSTGNLSVAKMSVMGLKL